MLACMRTIYGLILALFDEAGIRSLVVGLQGFEVWGASELLQRGFEFFRTTVVVEMCRRTAWPRLRCFLRIDEGLAYLYSQITRHPGGWKQY